MNTQDFSTIYIFIFFSLISALVLGNSVSPLMISFKEDRSALSRKYNNSISEVYFNRMDQLFSEYIKDLESIAYGELSIDEQTDYHLFQNYLSKQKYQNQLARDQFAKVAHIPEMLSDLESFYLKRQQAVRPDARMIANDFQAAEKKMVEWINMSEKSKGFDSWQEASLASKSVEALRNSVEEAYRFYNDYDPEFTWWVKQPWIDLEKQLKTFESFLENYYDPSLSKDDGSGIVGRPIGKETLEKELRFEMIPYTADALIAEAEKQYEWCLMEMKRASSALGFGNNWKEALEFVKDKYVLPGEWPPIIVDMANEAIDFVEKKDLISIPNMAKETWRTQMLSAEAQRVSPFFLGGESILIAYPTSTMTHSEKMMSLRGNNPHFARAVVHHELIPGHHLQQFMNRRHHTHRNGLGTAFWIEGWALYWEFTLWNHGFASTPEDQIGMLFWRMHRAARIIFSLSYHMEQMTPQECIDFLVDKVGHERANAEAEVRRSFTGGYGPLYQIAYMVGGLQLSALRNELVESGIMKEKAFHDFIITQNNMPIALLRQRLKEAKIPQNELEPWHFLEMLPK